MANIETVQTLIKAGFSADEIRQLTGMNPAESTPAEPAPAEPEPERTPVESAPADNSSDLYKSMMNEFQTAMENQMKAFTNQMEEFRKTVQMANVHRDVNSGDNGQASVQDVIANIIRPTHTKGE